MGEWISAMGDLNFSFGARLHGNIVAMQCGVPALVVVHDERTRELAECLALPHVLLEDFFCLRSLTEAVEITIERLAGYPARRRELAREYVGMLTDNGLVPSIGLRGVAA
jgi:polysaccharide pyruvyl transferase WcaK-like protein